MRKLQFTKGEFYHIYNRGTEKRIVFSNKNDYYRFLYLLFACNDTAPLLNSQHYYRGSASIVNSHRKRNLLVDIVCFCLMPNHYHLILRERTDGGIQKFMQKLGTGYTMYFNTKYDRNGVLFQGAFKAIRVDQESYFTHLTRYIHLNPAELCEPLWKDNGIKKQEGTFKFVKEYPWSSLSDYLGKHRFEPLLDTKTIKELALPPQAYDAYMMEWIAEHRNLLGGLTLED